MVGFSQNKLGSIVVHVLLTSTRRKIAANSTWAFLIFLSALSSVNATSVLYLTDKALTKKSALVVFGEVVSQQTLVNEQGYVCTDVELKVDKVVRGSIQSNLITIRRYGGNLGGLEYRIEGNANLAVGDRALLFLTRKQDEGFFVVTGFAQGNLTVVEQTDTGDFILERDVSGLNFVGLPGSHAERGSGTEINKQKMLLSEITRNISN